jgi:hypothetical protein
MSGSRRNRAPSRPHRLLAAGALLLASAGAVQIGTVAPAPYIKALVPNAGLVGRARLSWLGLPIYDAALFAGDSRFRADQPGALELTYARTFSGRQIAQRSVAEIEKLGQGTAQERARWLAILERLIPDLNPGDRLTGSYAAGRGILLRNGTILGELGDEKLVRAFFAIWLGQDCSEPTLRAQLLGAR